MFRDNFNSPHVCTAVDCNQELVTQKGTTAHHRLYVHAKLLHGTTITLSCFDNCKYKKEQPDE